MKNHLFTVAITLFLTTVTLAQECSPSTDTLAALKHTVHSIVKGGEVAGYDIKRFWRSGDMVAVAILQTLSDSEMATPDTARQVLSILREAFGCPSTCIADKAERVPRVTILLLDHLQDSSGGTLRSEVTETKKYILEQTSKAE